MKKAQPSLRTRTSGVCIYEGAPVGSVYQGLCEKISSFRKTSSLLGAALFASITCGLAAALAESSLVKEFVEKYKGIISTDISIENVEEQEVKNTRKYARVLHVTGLSVRAFDIVLVAAVVGLCQLAAKFVKVPLVWDPTYVH